MPCAEVVTTRSSRQRERSFEVGFQAAASFLSLKGLRERTEARASKLGLPWTLPESSSAERAASVRLAARAASAGETLDMARALRMTSPRWSSKFIQERYLGEEWVQDLFGRGDRE